jgi:hypothetical protein
MLPLVSCFANVIYLAKNESSTMKRVVGMVPVAHIEIDRLPLRPDGLDTTLALMLGVAMPPIHLQLKVEGGWLIKDGRHRLLAHKLLGREEILARWSTRRRLR